MISRLIHIIALLTIAIHVSTSPAFGIDETIKVLPIADPLSPPTIMEKSAPPIITETPSKSPLPTEETQPLGEQEEDSIPSPNTIILQGLNKVTGHISQLKAPIGTVMRFGNLEIIGRRCWESPPDEQPEKAGLLEIWELKPDESHKRIFLGWVFSSSPGLSALEHPIYDVTILGCALLKDPESIINSNDNTVKNLAIPTP